MSGLIPLDQTSTAPFGSIIPSWRQEQEIFHNEMRISTESVAQIKISIKKSDKIQIEKNRIAMEADQINGVQTGNFKLHNGHDDITVTSL